MASENRLPSLNPLYVAAYLYLWIGLLLVVYHGPTTGDTDSMCRE